MKKHLLKLTLLAFVMLFGAETIQAQEYEEYTKPGYYTIGAAGTDFLLTIDGATGNLVWSATALTGDNAQLQQFAIQDHVTPAGAGYVQITAKFEGVGTWTLAAASTTVEADGKNITIVARAGDPVQVEALAGDHSGLDQFQRRKTGTSRGGNDALFFKTDWSGGSRYGVVPTAEGDPFSFDGGGIDKIEFKFIKDIEATASVNTFGLDVFSISNPVNNQLTIKGATSKVNQLSIYSILGNKVMSKSLNNSNGDISVNVSSLSTGLYIVEMTGNEGQRFTKKIIKQ